MVGEAKTQNDLSQPIHGELGADSWCVLKSCGKRFVLKTHNQRFCCPGHQQEHGVGAYKDGVKRRDSRGMHITKVSGSPSQRRILHLLQDGRSYTTRQIQEKAKVCNPATWISSLNKQGYSIECKYYGVVNGSKIYHYTLKGSSDEESRS